MILYFYVRKLETNVPKHEIYILWWKMLVSRLEIYLVCRTFADVIRLREL